MKRKNKGRKLLISLICLVLVASIGAGIWYFAGNTGGEPAVSRWLCSPSTMWA